MNVMLNLWEWLQTFKYKRPYFPQLLKLLWGNFLKTWRYDQQVGAAVEMTELGICCVWRPNNRKNNPVGQWGV